MANVSVNIIDIEIQEQVKRYIQIGTVMTDCNYRNKGLSRKLMDKILQDWKDKCDAIYLYANDSVLDFYPKFGFIKAMEYQYSKNNICSSFMSNCIYYLEDIDTVIIVNYDGETMTYFDIYCDADKSMDKIIATSARESW